MFNYGNAFLITDKIAKCTTYRPRPVKLVWSIPEHMEKSQKFHPHAYDSWGFGMTVLDLLLFNFDNDYPKLYDDNSINLKHDYLFNDLGNNKMVLKKNFIKMKLLENFNENIKDKYKDAKYVLNINQYNYVFLELLNYVLDYILNDDLSVIPNMKTISQDFYSFQSFFNKVDEVCLYKDKRKKIIINRSLGDRVNFNNIYVFGPDEKFSDFITIEENPGINSEDRIDKTIVPQKNTGKGGKLKSVVVPSVLNVPVVENARRIAEFIDYNTLKFALVSDYLEIKKLACKVNEIPNLGSLKNKLLVIEQAKAFKSKFKVDPQYFCFTEGDVGKARITQQYNAFSFII
jgi:hypothetical protein